MQTYAGIADAADAARQWLTINESTLPEHLQSKLTALTKTGTSPVDTAMIFAEAVYANQTDFTQDAKDIASGCAMIGETFGFHGLAADFRGSRIAKVLDGLSLDGAEEPEAQADLLPPPPEQPEA